MDVAWPFPNFTGDARFLVECKSRIELSDHTGTSNDLNSRVRSAFTLLAKTPLLCAFLR
jgi:hypothetical protein